MFITLCLFIDQGSSTHTIESNSPIRENDESDEASHRDENQVRLDTDRAFTVFPEGKFISPLFFTCVN